MYYRLAVTLFISILIVNVSIAQHNQAPEFFAVAIFKFSENILWPSSASINNYRIHIIDDQPYVANELTTIAKNRKLHNRRVIVSRTSTVTIPKNTHVIFLANHNSALLADVVDKISKSPILLISNDIQDKRNIMINFKSNNINKAKILFEINKANIINSALSIAPDIILLGGTEVDVAHLYRDSQEELLIKERKLNAVEGEVVNIKKEKILMEKILSSLSEVIEKQKKQYNYLEKTSNSQKNKIKLQEDELNKREKHLKNQKSEIESRSLILLKQQKSIEKQVSQMTIQDSNIKSQEKIIENQKNRINQQDVVLEVSSVTIENQKKTLLILSFLSILVAVGALVSFWLYKKNKSTKNKLLIALSDSKKNFNRIEVVNSQLKSFSYTVSHDLRAPLRSISGFSQIILLDHREYLSDEITGYLNRIVNCTVKMDQLIEDILLLSRLTQSEVKYNDNVNISTIVKDEFEQLNLSQPRQDVELMIQQDVMCRCDPALMTIVIANLVGNAWKYTPYDNAAVFKFGTILNNNELVYFMEDNGVGFNDGNASNIFEAFQRLHSSTEFEGTGVGLATVKRIISLHQGNVWAESTVGKGATFYFTLN